MGAGEILWTLPDVLICHLSVMNMVRLSLTLCRISVNNSLVVCSFLLVVIGAASTTRPSSVALFLLSFSESHWTKLQTLLPDATRWGLLWLADSLWVVQYNPKYCPCNPCIELFHTKATKQSAVHACLHSTNNKVFKKLTMP